MSDKLNKFVWVAARSDGDFTKMIELMDAGECDANTKMQQSGESFLHIAALHGDMDTCKYLIELGANLNARTNKVCSSSPTRNHLNSNAKFPVMPPPSLIITKRDSDDVAREGKSLDVIGSDCVRMDLSRNPCA